MLNKFNPLLMATVMSTAVTVPLLFVLPFVHLHLADYGLKRIGILAIITVLSIALHFSNAKSLQYLEASVYSVLYNLRILITTVLGILFLNEKIIPLQIAGGLIIFLAIVTVRQKGSRSLTFHGFEWGIIAALVISLVNLFEKEVINSIGYLAYIIPTWPVITALLWAMLIKSKQASLAIFKQKQVWLLMVLRAISAYGFGLAFYYGGKLSVATYISSLSVIIMVVLGITLLGERDYLKQKVVATAMAVTGLTLILIANVF